MCIVVYLSLSKMPVYAHQLYLRETLWLFTSFKSIEVSHTSAPVVFTNCIILRNLCQDNGDIVESEQKDVETRNDSNDDSEPTN